MCLLGSEVNVCLFRTMTMIVSSGLRRTCSTSSLGSGIWMVSTMVISASAGSTSTWSNLGEGERNGSKGETERSGGGKKK